MTSSVREPLTDGPASEPVRAVAPSPRAPKAPEARAQPAAAGGNAAIQRLVSGHLPHAGPAGLLAAGGNRALGHLHARATPVRAGAAETAAEALGEPAG